MKAFSRQELLSKFTEKLNNLQQKAQPTAPATIIKPQNNNHITHPSSNTTPNIVKPLEKKEQKISDPVSTTSISISKTVSTNIELNKFFPFKSQVSTQIEERKQNNINSATHRVEDKISRLKREIIENAERQAQKKIDKKVDLQPFLIQERKKSSVQPQAKTRKDLVTSPFSIEQILPKMNQIQTTKQKKQVVKNKRIEKQNETERLNRFFSDNNFSKIEKPAKNQQPPQPTKEKEGNKKQVEPVQNSQPIFTQNINDLGEQFDIKSTSPVINPNLETTPSLFNETPSALPTPYLYMINNLLLLSYSKLIPPQIIILYIDELHIRHNLPYASIVITFGIEYLISKFYEMHDMELHSQFEMNGKYIVYYLDLLLPDFIVLARIRDWNTIWEIGRGVTLRFGKQTRKVGNSTEWMYFAICRKKQKIKQAGIDLNKILEARLTRERRIIYTNREPVVQYEQSFLEQLKNKHNFSTLDNYLEDRKKRIPELVLQDVNQEVLADSVEKQGIDKTRLYEYKKMRETINPVQPEQDQKKIQFVEEKEYEIVSFQILKLKSKLPPNVIIHRTYNVEVVDEYVAVEVKSESEDDNSSRSSSSGGQSPVKKFDEEGKPIVYSHVVKKTIDNRVPEVKIMPVYNYGQQDTSVGSIKNTRKSRFYTGRKTVTPSIPKSQILKSRIKQKTRLNTQQILKKMDSLISEYHEKNPEFTMDEFMLFLSKILTNVIKVPTSLHEKLTTMWMSKYC